jgi:hypothetical protein
MRNRVDKDGCRVGIGKIQHKTSAYAERWLTLRPIAGTILSMVLNDSATQLPISPLKSSPSNMHIRRETLKALTLVQPKCALSPSRPSSKHISYLLFR